MKPTILIDSREQRPYEFQVPSKVEALPTGDYSLEGLELSIAVERKELNDLIGCLTTDRGRFEKELLRGRALDFFCLVIESSLSDIAKGHYRSKMNPAAAVQSLMAFSIRYRLPIFFCETRNHAQRITESLLLKYAREVEKKYKSITTKEKRNNDE